MSLLHTTFLGKEFTNPLVLASGFLGISASSMGNAVQNGAGGVSCKSLTTRARPGHANPTVLVYDGGMINAVGLSGEGVDDGVEELRMYKKRFPDTPLIASVFGETLEGFGEAAKTIEQAGPDFIEVNISCPNVKDEIGMPFACSAADAAEVTHVVKAAVKTPVIIKLAPNVPNFVEIAKKVEAAGADALCAINTMPGMLIDAEMRRPSLKNGSGGVSGPALKPVALKCVHDIAQAVQIPIIGTGGVSTGRDAVEIIMAGATLVGVGTAIHYRGIEVFAKIAREMEELMMELGYGNVDEMRGIASEASKTLYED